MRQTQRPVCLVKGHAANRENKRCDEIAEAITHLPGLPEDQGYKKRSGLIVVVYSSNPPFNFW